eukprot:g31367.t1
MEPTREQAILDLIPCDETGIIDNLIVRDPLGRNNHSIAEFKIQMEDKKVKSNTRVLFLNKRDYNGMREKLAKNEKGDLIMGNEEMAEVLNGYFVSVFMVEDTNNMPIIDNKEAMTVLGLQLFTIYRDDLELETKCNMLNFAGDMKMSGRAKCAEDTQSLQRDTDRL